MVKAEDFPTFRALNELDVWEDVVLVKKNLEDYDQEFEYQFFLKDSDFKLRMHAAVGSTLLKPPKWCVEYWWARKTVSLWDHFSFPFESVLELSPKETQVSLLYHINLLSFDRLSKIEFYYPYIDLEVSVLRNIISQTR